MKKIFMCVFTLTIFDAAATAVGVKLGYLKEANPLIVRMMDMQPFITGLAICFATGLLLLALYKLENRIWWLKYAMSGILIVKSAIVCLHIAYACKALNTGYFSAEQGLFCSLLFFIGIG